MTYADELKQRIAILKQLQRSMFVHLVKYDQMVGDMTAGVRQLDFDIPHLENSFAHIEAALEIIAREETAIAEQLDRWYELL